MKTIAYIAKNELRHLFYSSVAWFLAIIFMVLCGYTYMAILKPSAEFVESMLQTSPDVVKILTQSATATVYQAYFPNILPRLYLFIPLLTMGVISREFNNSSYKLLYSSPVTTRNIVLGKYLALLIFNFILVFIMGMFIVSGFFDIKDMDYPPTLSALLGIYLFLCALTAIGLFASSLSAYPIVAAIASFTFLFVLMSIGELWQQYDVVRDITWFLSISNRTEKMIRGLIRSTDILYYLVIIYMFVGFTIVKLRGGRETKPWYIKAARYVIIILVGLSVGYIGSRPQMTGYWDVTDTKSNTLDPKTRTVLRALGDSALEVTLYTNLLSKDVAVGLPKARNTWLDLWEPYIRVKRNISFKYEYFYAIWPGDSSYYKTFPGKSLQQIAGLVAKGLQVDSALFKSPAQIGRMINLRDPQNYYLFAQLRYKGRSTFLRFLPGETGLDMNGGTTEPHIIAALHRLLKDPMPRVAFVSGELERNIYKLGEREYYSHAIAPGYNALTSLGFDVDTINLATQEIPADVKVLVLADPKRTLSPLVMDKIHHYIDQGRNLFILGEPGKQYVLNPLLQPLGIEFTKGQLVQVSDNETADKITPYWTQPYLFLADEATFMFWRRWLGTHLRPDSSAGLLQGVTGISVFPSCGFDVTPLLLTQPDKTWSKMEKLVTDSAAPVFSPEQGDIRKASFSAALRLSRQQQNKTQRIVVYGDADVASNLRLQTDLVRSVYSWLADNQYPVYTGPCAARDNTLLLTVRRAVFQKVIYVWILPGILLIIASVLLIRRKRQ